MSPESPIKKNEEIKELHELENDDIEDLNLEYNKVFDIVKFWRLEIFLFSCV